MDFRVDADFLEHPKTLHLLELAGSDGLVWLLRLWSYTAKHRPDGVLCGMNAARIDSALRFAYESLETSENMDVSRFKTLCDSGWLSYNFDTKNYEVSGWKEYQSWVIGAKERSESAKKAAKSRWDNKPTADAPRIHSAMRSAYTPHDAVVDAPSPSPSPSPKDKEKKELRVLSPNGDHHALIDFWMDQYQTRTGVKYLFNDAKDGKIVKEILRKLQTLDTAKMFISEFFQTTEEFIVDRAGFTIGVFITQLNKIAQRLSTSRVEGESEIDRYNRLSSEEYMKRFDAEGKRIESK